jgi:hypothetical protein
MSGASIKKPVSPAAERMRDTRYRRALGLRSIRFEVHDDQINALIARQLLAPDKRTDSEAIALALYAIVDRILPVPASVSGQSSSP